MAGVFAARFGLDGSIDDPSISFNPVSALTPGFLRDIFSIFDKPAAAPRPPAKTALIAYVLFHFYLWRLILF